MTTEPKISDELTRIVADPHQTPTKTSVPHHTKKGSGEALSTPGKWGKGPELKTDADLKAYIHKVESTYSSKVKKASPGSVQPIPMKKLTLNDPSNKGKSAGKRTGLKGEQYYADMMSDSEAKVAEKKRK